MRQLRRKCAALLGLRWGLSACALWIFAWGTAVVAVRVAGGGTSPLLWAGAAGLAVAAASAIGLAWRRAPSLENLMAHLERRGRHGGLLVASTEVPLGEWGERLGPVRVPRLRARWKRPAALLAMASAFLAAAWRVPLPEDPARDLLNVDQAARELAEQIEVLEEEKIVADEQAGSMREQLAGVRDQAAADEPGRAYEALDHLSEQARQQAMESAQEAVRASEQLAQAQELARAMSLEGDAWPAELQAQAAEQLAARMSQIQAELASSEQFPSLSGKLPALSPNALEPEALKALDARLQAGKDALLRTLERLDELRLIDAEILGRCRSAGKCDGEGLAAFLSENAEDILAQGGLARCKLPGRGGITRGPGHAELTFGEEGDESRFKTSDMELPPAALPSLEDAELAGVTRSAPQARSETASQGGALNEAQAGGGSAATRRILPRHRGAVQRYFERAPSGGRKDQKKDPR